jgi:riboflavin biosynthesis pyrimidine reductase
MLTNVLAISLDGVIGKSDAESDEERRAYGFTNDADKHHVKSILQETDVVITGGKSLRAANAAWEVVNDRGQQVAWVVLTNAGLPKDLKFWTQSNIRRVVVSENKNLQEDCLRHGVEFWLAPKSSPALFVVSQLHSLNLSRQVLFGGGEINRMFYAAGVVDYAKITLCPLIVGGVTPARFMPPGLEHPVNLELETFVRKENLVFLNYKIQK